ALRLGVAVLRGSSVELDCLVEILFQPETLLVHQTQSVLGPAAFMVGGFLKPFRRLGIILWKIDISKIIKLSEMDLRIQKVLFGRLTEPVGGFAGIFRNAMACQIQRAEVVLCEARAFFGRFAVPLPRFPVITLATPPLAITTATIIHRLHVSVIGRLAIKLRRLVQVSRDAVTGGVSQAKRKFGRRIAFLCFGFLLFQIKLRCVATRNDEKQNRKATLIQNSHWELIC